MKISRKFTQPDKDVFEGVQWTKRSSRILNPDGSVVFEMNDAEVPEDWSQLATDIVVSKYFRKAGVPQTGEDGELLRDDAGKVITGPERSVRQVVHRLAGCWQHWGQQHGYFDTQEDAEAFYAEMAYMLLHQFCAPNSPQWFNTGLHFAYGMSGPAQGHWIADPMTGEPEPAEDAYSHPQPHACFIQSISDDLVNPGGIMDLWVREARLFKYGSGTGTNFSKLRGEDEQLSGGGKSSGLMSWLKIGDRAAGAIKSGGTTRRAAKMVCLDLDHPDIEQFIQWKVREEIKVAAMVEGLKDLGGEHADAARVAGLSLDYDFNGEAYTTVSGQNSNNSVRISDAFFRALDQDGDWQLVRRTDGAVAKSLPARQLWDQIAYAAWRCADPGVQFDGAINQWHTCPVNGRINASNPCSEYMFLDDTACNLASLNLLKFYDPDTREFDIDAFEHAVGLWTLVLEISVLMAAFPSRQIARMSYAYRTLGLGYANLGAMLMQAGIPYDSDHARSISGAITAILTGRSYATSAKMAAQLGPFAGYFKNKEHMLRVIRNHRRAAYGVSRNPDETSEHQLGDYEDLEIGPVSIDSATLEELTDVADAGAVINSEALLRRARTAWDDALNLGQQHGFRNAQVTVIAPTGTIGLLMDCDTTGVEPDFALVKFKKLAGGGYFKIANQSIRPALKSLGYSDEKIRHILTYVMGSLDLNVPVPHLEGGATQMFADYLHERGLTKQDRAKIEGNLASAMDLRQAFGPWVIGDATLKRLGLEDESDILGALDLTRGQIDLLSEQICGTGTVEGAPHLQSQHMPIFDCANKCGRAGKRFIAVDGHIRMMASAQPFISGAISKTINLPHEASVEDIKKAYRLSWELGLKANALYRDGCKLSQPLSATSDLDEQIEDEEGIEAGKEEVAAEVISVADQVASAVTDDGTTDLETGAVKRPVEKVVERIVERPLRRRLPDTRRSVTHKFNIAGHEGYLTVGLYENGSPGELFITMAKEGSTIGGLMDSLGTAISVALQYGVPVESLVRKFTHQRFEPAGMTHNVDIPFAKSLVDYIFRWMGMEFIRGYRAANAPRRAVKEEPRTEAVTEIDQSHRPGAPAAASHDAKGNGNGSGNHGDDVDAGSGRMSTDVGDLGDSAGVEPQRLKLGADTALSDPADSSTSHHKSILGMAMRELQTDAPACDQCGTITVRSGTCYKCLNCGHSMGCS